MMDGWWVMDEWDDEIDGMDELDQWMDGTSHPHSFQIEEA